MLDDRTQSISERAEAEQSNVNRHLELLGDTYDLTSRIENLYASLPSTCRFPLDAANSDATHAASVSIYLIALCHREVTIEMHSLLRGYRNDSLFHRRRAIELCAYAAKMKRHPAFSRIWLNSGGSEEKREKFRQKFTKLFPADDPDLTFLSSAFEEASRAMHNSLTAIAHYFTIERMEEFPKVNLFDITHPAMLVATFLQAMACHLVMIRVFRGALGGYVVNGAGWEREFNSARSFLDEKGPQWVPMIKAAKAALGKP